MTKKGKTRYTHKKTKRIDKKLYKHAAFKLRKYDAEKLAESYRKKGYNARVVEENRRGAKLGKAGYAVAKGYSVYIRHKKTGCK